jgi:hypothetical protein
VAEVHLSYVSGIHLEGLRNNMRRQLGQSTFGQDLKSRPLEFEARLLIARPEYTCQCEMYPVRSGPIVSHTFSEHFSCHSPSATGLRVQPSARHCCHCTGHGHASVLLVSLRTGHALPCREPASNFGPRRSYPNILCRFWSLRENTVMV